MAATDKAVENMTETSSERIQIADGNHRLVEHRFDLEQRVDGSCVTGVHKSYPLPTEFAVLVDDAGSVDVSELTDEQRAWLDAESGLEATL